MREELPKFDPFDPFDSIMKRLIEVLKDPDYKPHLIELIKAHTRDVESQTLARLQRIRTPRAP